MFRSLLIFGLASSLMAVCQAPAGVTVNGGYVAPAMPGPPVLTPPNAALPGDGPATGAPPDMNVNDSRSGGAGSVFEPSGGTLIGSALPETPAPTVVTGTSNTATNGEKGTTKVFETGMGSFSSGTSDQPQQSLGDIARRYKAERASKHPREFDNSSIRHASYGTTDTNSADLPQSDQASATYGSSGTASVPQGVMNAGDYASVQAALARSQAAANVNATDNTLASEMPDPNRAAYEAQDDSTTQQPVTTYAPQSTGQTNNATQNAGEATTPQVDNQAKSNTAKAKKQLPASASDLPLFAFLGLMVLAVGGIFARTRRREVRF